MRGTGSQRQPWRRHEVGNILRSWRVGIDGHADQIREVAGRQVPIVELRTGETVHSGHLAGLLGGESIVDGIMDVVGGLVNAFSDHAVLVLPAQMLYLLHSGRSFNILPELRHAATTISVFGNTGRHWTLYIANTLTRQLYSQDTMDDRKGRSQPPQLETLWTWPTNNVSDGAPW